MAMSLRNMANQISSMKTATEMDALQSTNAALVQQKNLYIALFKSMMATLASTGTAISERHTRQLNTQKEKARKDKQEAGRLRTAETKALAAKASDNLKATATSSNTPAAVISSQERSAIFLHKFAEEFNTHEVHKLEELAEEHFDKPWIFKNAVAISDGLNAEACKPVKAQCSRFSAGYQNSQVVKTKGRTQTQLKGAGADAVQALFDGIVEKCPRVDVSKIPDVQPYLRPYIFGIIGDQKCFGPDYLFLSTLRYQLEGVRRIVMIDFKSYLGLLEKDNIGFNEFMANGLCLANTSFIKKVEEKHLPEELAGKVFCAELKSGEALFVPGNFVMWEFVREATIGLRKCYAQKFCKEEARMVLETFGKSLADDRDNEATFKVMSSLCGLQCGLA